MSTELVEADRVADLLTLGIFETVCRDPAWQLFGFRKRPKRGSLWGGFIGRNRVAVERFLLREFLTVSLAITVRSVRVHIDAEWRVPLVARVVSNLVSRRDVRTITFRFQSLEDALQFLGDGTSAYLFTPMEGWNAVFLGRAPTVQSQKWAGRLFVGAALLLEPTRSIFPHVVTSSTNVVTGYKAGNQVTLPPECARAALALAERLLASRLS